MTATGPGNEKGPVAGAFRFAVMPCEGRRSNYFFFLAGAFFLAAAFLVAFFIEVNLPYRILRFKKSQCDSYIELPDSNVKKKMRLSAHVRRTARRESIGPCETYA
jgi:hypothetical protein